jgi:hypothetical protein
MQLFFYIISDMFMWWKICILFSNLYWGINILSSSRKRSHKLMTNWKQISLFHYTSNSFVKKFNGLNCILLLKKSQHKFKKLLQPCVPFLKIFLNFRKKFLRYQNVEWSQISWIFFIMRLFSIQKFELFNWIIEIKKIGVFKLHSNFCEFRKVHIALNLIENLQKANKICINGFNIFCIDFGL